MASPKDARSHLNQRYHTAAIARDVRSLMLPHDGQPESTSTSTSFPSLLFLSDSPSQAPLVPLPAVSAAGLRFDPRQHEAWIGTLAMTMGCMLANGCQNAHIDYDGDGLALAVVIMSGYLGPGLSGESVRPS